MYLPLFNSKPRTISFSFKVLKVIGQRIDPGSTAPKTDALPTVPSGLVPKTMYIGNSPGEMHVYLAVADRPIPVYDYRFREPA